MPKIIFYDDETELPPKAAEKIKKLIDENETLKNRITELENENQALRQKLSEIESGSLGIRKVLDESGDRVEFAPSDQFIAQLTADGVLKPIEPNVLRIGDENAYLNDVITANITVASALDDKENIVEIDEKELEKIVLPKPKKYKRKVGKGGEEIGFIAEEMPEILRRGNGYDLKALITILAWKVQKLEEIIVKLKQK